MPAGLDPRKRWMVETPSCAASAVSNRTREQCAALALILVLWMAAAADAAEAPPPDGVRVTVVRPKSQCFSATVRVSGSLVPRMEALLQIDPDGSRVTEVLVAPGDTVAAGQVMAKLAHPTFDAAGDQARRGAGTPGELAAHGGANPPTAAPSPASGPLTTNVEAPFAGKVLDSSARVGAVASPLGEPLFRIAADSEIEAEVEVPAVHVAILAPGQTARVEVEDGRELSGHVRLVFVEVNPITQLGRARIAVGDDPSLVAGKFIRATIDARRSCGLAIPRSAIFLATQGARVQVLRDSVIETRNVHVGLRSDDYVEIRDGLREGDVVVANAGTSLQDGDAVTPVFLDGTN
jgi:HlyD family secretion protein